MAKPATRKTPSPRTIVPVFLMERRSPLSTDSDCTVTSRLPSVRASPVGMPAIPLSSAKPAGSSYYKDHANYEVEDLHDFMEHRHLCFEKKHCADDDDARD